MDPVDLRVRRDAKKLVERYRERESIPYEIRDEVELLYERDRYIEAVDLLVDAKRTRTSRTANRRSTGRQ